MAYQSYSYAPAPSYGLPPPAPSYGYSAPASQLYQPIPPPSAAQLDPFRAWYADRLRELTFNSRPLIQELSITAMQQRDQNQWANMTAVVEEIESAVYRSPPHEKLPKLYLLDSISKNVGQPYTTHLLQQAIPRLYVRTHREVDGVTKVKMEEMISLWRRSGPGGTELYGPAAREAVEREVFGAGGVGGAGAGSGGPGQQRMNAPVGMGVTRESVLAAIHATIGVKQGEAAHRAWDRSIQTQLTALMGLSEMLNTRHVQPAELQQIMDQLRGMGYQAPPAPVPVPVPAQAYPPPRPTIAPSYPPSHAIPSPYPPVNAGAAPALPPFAPTLHNYDQPLRSSHTPPYPPNIDLPSTSAAQAPAPPAVPMFDANMLNILNSLAGAGGLSLPGSTPRTPEAAPIPLKVERTRLDDYEDMVLGLNLSLSNLDMNRMTALPLQHLPVQCSQCAARFPSDGEQLNAHMDWHARRNKQERTSSGRGAHRRWLPRAEEWVRDIPVAGSSTAPDTLAGMDGSGNGAGPSGESPVKNSSGVGAGPAGKPMKSAEELQKKWVRVPEGQGAGGAGAVCPICKEGFKREWAESEEEWVWRNAIDISGKIMHATCRQQQLMANRLARVAKGRSGSAGGTSSKSPGMTPEADGEGAQVKVEPHPLSHSVVPGDRVDSEGPKADSVMVEQAQKEKENVNGDGAVQALGLGQDVQEQETVVKAEVVEPRVTPMEGIEGGGEGGNAGKRKAEEDAEEERKRVKVEPVDTVQEAEQVVEQEVQVVSSDPAQVDQVADEASREGEVAGEI